MKIHIELDMPPRTRKILLGVGLAAVLVSGGVAYAQVPSPATTASDALIGVALNQLGTAVATLQVQVAALQAADHVARATLAPSGGVMGQTGSFIRQVNHSSTGKYVLTFAPNAFTSTPTCVTTPNSDGAPPQVACYGGSALSLTCQAASSTGPVDVGMSVICAGT